jgi:hypothetical protein
MDRLGAIPAGVNAMTDKCDLPEVLANAIEAHGIKAAIRENQVVLADSSLVFTLHARPHETRPDSIIIQLDVGTQAPLLADSVWHSFAGLGPSRPEAERNALGRFILGPLHTLLSALGNHQCPDDGTEWLEWHGRSGSWRVCTSPLLVHGGDPSSVHYSTFVHQLRDLFGAEVPPGLHWCEVFFASVDGKLCTAEVRLDNSLWPRASELLASWHVSPQEGYRSGRHFFVALPN